MAAQKLFSLQVLSIAFYFSETSLEYSVKIPGWVSDRKKKEKIQEIWDYFQIKKPFRYYYANIISTND